MDAVKVNPIFKNISEDILKEIIDKYFYIVKVNKAKILPELDCNERNLFIIKKGRANVYKVNNGQNVYMSTLKEGDAFGMVSLFNEYENEYPTQIIASEKCEMYVVSERDLKKIFSLNREIMLNYIAFLTNKIRFLNRKIETYTSSNVNAKLAGYILSNMNSRSALFKIDMSIAKTAQELNVGRASLYRAFEYLEEINAIKKNGKEIIILDIKSLNEVHGGM